MFLSGKDTIGESQYFRSEMRHCINVKEHLDGFPGYSYHGKPADPWNKPHLDLLFPKIGSTIVIGFRSSTITLLGSV